MVKQLLVTECVGNDCNVLIVVILQLNTGKVVANAEFETILYEGSCQTQEQLSSASNFKKLEKWWEQNCRPNKITFLKRELKQLFSILKLIRVITIY